MNNLIQELAEQAMTNACLEINPNYKKSVANKRLLKSLEDYNQKLTELIVKKCAKIADEGYGSDHFGNGIAGYQLLEHFGVKE